MADLLINVKVQGGDKAEKSLGSIGEAAKKATSSIGSLQDELKRQQGVTNKSIQEATKLSNKLNELSLAEKALVKGVRELNNGLISSTQFTTRYSKAVGLLRAEVRNSYGENLKYSTSLDRVATSMKNATAAEKKLEASQGRLGGVFKTVKAAAIGYATVLATMELTNFVKGTVQAGVELDSLQRSFKAITGSSHAAGVELKYINDTAKTLGLELTSLEKSYKDIYAASKNTSLEGTEVRKVFTAISKSATVLGMSVDDTQGSLRALSQMISKGNVQAEELRGQLGERLPGAFQMAAEAMGVSTQKLNDMLENGEVLAEDLLPKLAEVLEKRFGNAAVDAANSARASFNRLTNAMTELHRTVGENGLIDSMADLAVEMNDLLTIHKDLIASGLGTIFDAATSSAELFLDASSGVLKVLEAIKSVREINLGEVYAGSGQQKKLLKEITQAYSDIAVVQSKLSYEKDADEVEKLTKQLEKLEAKSWDLNAAYDETVKVQKKKLAWEGHIQDETIRGANKIQEAIKNKNKVELFLEGEKYDELDQKRRKDIQKEKDKYAQYMAAAKRANEYIPGSVNEKEIVEAREKAIAAIEEKYSEKRTKLREREINRNVRLYNRQVKAVDKALKEEFDDLDKYQDEYIKAQEKYEKELKKISLTSHEYQIYLIEEEKKEFIAKGLSGVKAEKLTTERLKKLYKERAASARSSMLDIYSSTNTKTDDYWQLRSDDIDDYIEKLYDAGVSEEAIAAASAEKWKEYNDEKAKSESDFLGSIAAGLHDYQDEYKSWGENISEITKEAAEGMEDAFSDTLFDALKGDIDNITDVWTSFMDTMLHSLTDTVSEMAVQWGVGAIGTATGWWESGAWEVKQDHVAVVHAGEMIVPADVASILRSGEPTDKSQISELAKVSPSGGYEWSQSDKDTLTGMMNNPSSQLKNDIGEMSALNSESFSKATSAAARSMVSTAAQGMSLVAQNSISASDLAAGLLGPGLGQAAMAGVTSYAKNEMGLTTSNWSNVSGLLGSTLGSLVGGVPGGVIGDLLGSYAGMALGDMLDARDEEETRDLLEEAFGWISGQRAFASIDADSRAAVAEAISNASWGNASTFESTNWGGFTDLSSDISFSSSGMFDTSSFGTDYSGAFSGGSSNSGRSSGSSSDGPGNGNDSGSNGASSDGNGNDGSDSSYATGGYIDSLMVPYGEDGWAAVQFGEGVVSKEGMEALEKLNEGNLEDFYPTYDDDRNLESVINATNSIQKAIYEAIGKDVSTTLTLQDAGIVLESDNMTKVVELFDSIAEGGVNAEELETAFQAFVGVGLSTDDAVSATELLIEVYEEEQAAIEELQETLEAATEEFNALSESDLGAELLDVRQKWIDLVEALSEAGEALETITEAEENRNEVLGAAVTGLTASSIESNLFSSTFDDIIDSLKQSMASSYLAEAIYNSYLAPINEEIGRIWLETGDIAVVLKSIEDIDLSAAQATIDAVSEAFGWVDESTELTEAKETLEDLQDALDDAIDAYEDALDTEIDAQEDIRDAAQDLVDTFQDLADTLEETRDSLFESSVTSEQSLSYLTSSFNKTFTEAMSGDTDALSSLSDLAESVISSAESSVADPDALRLINEDILKKLATAETYSLEQVETQTAIVDSAQEQIDILTEQKDLLTTATEAVLSIEEAFAAYTLAQAAVDEQTAVVSSISSGSTSTATNATSAAVQYLTENQDVMDYYQANADSLGMSAVAFAEQHYTTYGVLEGREYPSFSGGGIATGPDSGYLANLHGTEAVIPLDGGDIPLAIEGSSSTSTTNNTQIVELLTSLISAINTGNKTQEEVYDILDRVTQGQTYINTMAVA